MRSVCVDSHIIIWGIREHAESDQLDMIPKTKTYFEYCKANDISIMVPSIVVGEVLTAIETRHHPMILNLLKSGFEIPPYDAQASALFAKLWREKKESGVVNEIREELQATRQELKADCMIVATAIAKNAEILYSHDDKLKRFANGSIEVAEIPSFQVQESLDFSLTDG